MSDANFIAARVAVKARLKQGPVTVQAGGGFDLRLKKELKLKYHQSVLSAVMKNLVEHGEVVQQTRQEKVAPQEGATTSAKPYAELTYTLIK